MLDRSDRRYWSDRSSVALDPTRPLYRFEAGALPLVSSGGPAAVTHLGIQVEVEYRDSVFFAGNRVPASVVLA